jgi:hypothetical protein
MCFCSEVRFGIGSKREFKSGGPGAARACALLLSLLDVHANVAEVVVSEGPCKRGINVFCEQSNKLVDLLGAESPPPTAAGSGFEEAGAIDDLHLPKP